MSGELAALTEEAARQHGVLTAGQLHGAGLSRRQVRQRIADGVFRRLPNGLVALAGAPDTWEHRSTWAALATLPIGGASHRTAARWWKFRSVDDDIDVVVRHPRRLILPGVKVVRSRDLMKRDLTWIEGMPVTTPERTLCDLGLVFPEAEVMRILRHAVATELVVPADVRRIRERIGRQGRNGAGIVGRCLDLLPAMAAAVESGVEVMFLELCDTFGLEPPVLQLPVVAHGRNYRLDFAFPAQRVFVEIDGASVHSAPQQIAADGGRQNDLVAVGWRPIRFTYGQLRRSPDRCFAQLRRLLGICAPETTSGVVSGAQIA